MNIENIRQISKSEPRKSVLHIGEDNIKYWLESYKNSNYQKVFWGSPNFYARGYDISGLVRATVETYTNPWYYFIKCRIKDDGLLTNGMDDSYSSDLDFRIAFEPENIKAIVIDSNVQKKDDIKLYFKKAEMALNLCRPDIIYVRSEFEDIVDEYAKLNKIQMSYTFEANIIKTLNKEGNFSCNYTVYTKG